MTNKDKASYRNGNPADLFQGRIGKTLAESQPWWAEPVKPPHGAPNVVIVYLDDLGFSDLGCFGSEIMTPNIDRLAAGGLRFVNYTTVPMCSPARAALLTGKNPHSVGCGWIAHANPGYPGYKGEISPDAPTLAETLKANGYSTMMVGKWHNTWSHDVHEAADRSSWPLQRGFERFYGFLDAETNYFCPDRIYEGNQLKEIDSYPDDYFATDDWTDRALSWLKSHSSTEPHKPFFLYMALNAPHMPIQAKPDDLAKYKGQFDAGWDAFRVARARKQSELGLFDRPHPLSPMPQGVPAWDSLEPETQALFARYMELYAALVDNIDQNVGRLLAHLEVSGQLDNTIVILSSDNGASAVGGLDGTPNFMEMRTGQKIDAALTQSLLQQDLIGTAITQPAYPTGWAQVSNTPFYYFKRTPANGGIRVPFVMHWPKGIAEQGGLRRQWIHVTDIAPTLLDVIGIAPLDHVGDLQARKADGQSFKNMLTHPDAPAVRHSQHYELEINRAYIEGDWKIVSLQPRGGQVTNLNNWMLFNLQDDPTECHDLATQHPEKVQAMDAAFDAEAWRNHVYPLDNRALERAITLPPFLMESVNTERIFYPGTQTISRVVVGPLIADRSFKITAQFEWQPGQEGVIYALGEAFSGLVLFVRDGHAQFVYHRWMSPIDLAPLPLNPGVSQLCFEYEAMGQRKGRGRLYSPESNSTDLHWTDMSPTMLGLHYEGLDVGMDRRQRTSDHYAGRGTFTYTGVIQRVTLTPGTQAPGSIMNRREDEAQSRISSTNLGVT
jgi:arylsulfatase A-like enzyme